MATIQERLQIKREPLDTWSIREQLALASAVAKSGDQNWMSVSRSLKPFGEANRPSDWFHQKNCAAQYGALLENVETPKRKKRISGSSETVVETPIETILRRLTKDRITELEQCLIEEKAEYLKLQEDMSLLHNGNVTEDLLDRWCKEIDEEEQQKEEESIAHAQWLKERELRKQEIERAWRPIGKPSVSLPPKRKVSDSIDSDLNEDGQHLTPPETPKPALSPLLTSLLKSPSQVPNVTNTSILHSAITSQRSINTNASTNINTTSTITNLLNPSPTVNVASTFQPIPNPTVLQETPVSCPIIPSTIENDILDESTDSLPNIKVEDLESSMLSSDDPLPEIKNEEVEVIISDLIQNADIVSDPEQHLQLDDNEDIITNLDNELQELCNEEEQAAAAAAEAEAAAAIAAAPTNIMQTDIVKIEEVKVLPKIDPFEFEEDPELSQITKPSSALIKYQETIDSILKKEPVEDQKQKEKELQSGSVEIVEVVVMEEGEVDKQLNKTQIQDIVHSIKQENVTETEDENGATIEEKLESLESERLDKSLPSGVDVKAEEAKISDETEHRQTSPAVGNLTPTYSETFFDDINMEVNKLDKSGKAKRDYSRTKKRESEKEFDILLAVEKAVNAQLDSSELLEDNFSDEKDYQEADKKFDPVNVKPKVKVDTDRSSSPWTEEEDMSSVRNKRRYSTPATPIDSVPNSPASSSAYFDDDRDYKNWKKSALLVYNRLTIHKYSSLFLKPITDDQAPGYHSLIYKPMDLQTIKKNIETGVIRSTLDFKRDALLMFTNAIMYNKTNGLVYNMAKQMQQESMPQIDILLQAQQDDLPLRRETRTSEPGNKRKRTTDDGIRNKKRKDD